VVGGPLFLVSLMFYLSLLSFGAKHFYAFLWRFALSRDFG
jgi:hypothetical protein